jgi:ribosomal protein L16 Arg81 hydroxylase
MNGSHSSHDRLAASAPPAGLSGLITPLDPATFGRDHWEREPLILHRGNPDFYASLLTLDDMDGILANSSLRPSELRVVADGKNALPRSVERSNRHAAHRKLETVYERYRVGATINLLHLHERWAPLGRLCRALSAELASYVQTNVYLTPAGSQGLTPHYDSHDVFVLQIYGTKCWRLYGASLELPLHDQRYRRSEDGPGDPVREFELEPGDLMYLPRGHVHDATSNEAASLHLTIGVVPVRFADVIRSAVAKVTAEDVAFRRALPLGFPDDPGQQAEAETAVAGLVERLTARLSAPDLIADAVASSLADREPELDNHLTDLEALRSLDLATTVRRRRGTSCKVSADATAARLEFHGKMVRLPAALEDELRFVAQAQEFTGRDIPGELDDPGRLVLIGSLVREGFLTVT